MWQATPLTKPHKHEPREHENPMLDSREREDPMLELRDLVKHYPSLVGEPVRAVDGVSLTVRAGEMVALYGPSGSGKTTLLLMIATLLAPTSGTVLIGGRDTSSLSEREASRFRLTQLGFIRQSFDLMPGVSAIDNAVLKLLGAMRWRRARREIEPLLIRLGLGERLYHRSETLSMGERQRVMIARALSTNPRLLLADEPTGSLDTQRGREVLELLRELCRERGVAVVLVSHDPMAARYADRVLVLRDGRLGDYDTDPNTGGEADGPIAGSGVGHNGVPAAVFTEVGTAGRSRNLPTSVKRP
jgi:putative ABC transport system ATP-binding protein